LSIQPVPVKVVEKKILLPVAGNLRAALFQQFGTGFFLPFSFSPASGTLKNPPSEQGLAEANPIVSKGGVRMPFIGAVAIRNQ